MKHFRLLFPLVAVLVNLAIAYVVYFVARVTFLAENWNTFANNLSWSHFFELMRGGFVFDTTAILYTNALWVVMMLLPVSRKENPTYQNVCRWLFIAVNTLAFVINLADSVYFQYTMRRTTTTVFNEFSEENNLGNIFLQEALHHWYFFLLTAVVIYGMAKFYAQPRLNYRQIDARRYAVVTSLSLLAFVPFCIAGMRGGWTRDTRPITISNANNYCDRPTEAGIVLNTPFSLIRTIGKNLFEVPDYFTDAQELEAVFTPVH